MMTSKGSSGNFGEKVFAQKSQKLKKKQARRR
jgi:hypothetical protein